MLNRSALQLPLPAYSPRGCSDRDLMILGQNLVFALCCSPASEDWSSENPQVSKGFLSDLSPISREHLLSLRLISIEHGSAFWNFEPFYGDGLLLFSDLESRRFEREFVWVRKKVESGSWQLTNSVSVQKGMRVLDLGTGSGLNALRLAQRGALSTGVDINPRAIMLAHLNMRLNGIDAEFLYGDWRSIACPSYDLLISQPPFDPVVQDGNRAFAFGGGAQFGLEYTGGILRLFQPTQSDQRMQIYVHSFIRQDKPLLCEVIERNLNSSCKSELRLLRSYSISDWWNQYRQRHRLGGQQRLPAEWEEFSGVGAYFLSVEI